MDRLDGRILLGPELRLESFKTEEELRSYMKVANLVYYASQRLSDLEKT